ncbi:MAG: hypothetical protein ACOX6H_01975 [Christensenellales bacterium]
MKKIDIELLKAMTAENKTQMLECFAFVSCCEKAKNVLEKKLMLKCLKNFHF